jgi:hypothetical protein
MKLWIVSLNLLLCKTICKGITLTSFSKFYSYFVKELSFLEDNFDLFLILGYFKKSRVDFKESVESL